MATLPKWDNYGQGRSERPNTLRFTIGRLKVWFSYQTPVAYQLDADPVVVRVNDWAQTTGKHLNWIDGGNDWKDRRIQGGDFEQRLADILRMIPA